MRVVIDTNIWVSALINPAGRPAEVLAAFRAGKFALVTGEALLDELHDVLTRPRIARKYRITASDAIEFVDLLRKRAQLVAITGAIAICRDPDDDVLLEIAITGNADALVSRDEDLTRAQEVAVHLAASNIQTLTVQHFLDQLARPGPPR